MPINQNRKAERDGVARSTLNVDHFSAFEQAKTEPLTRVRSTPRTGKNWQRPRHKQHRRYRLWSLLLISLGGILSLFIGSLLYLTTLPSVDNAEARVAAILKAHHGVDTGLPAPTKEGQAAVAVEDERFYQHHGIDSVGLIRAAWTTLTSSSVEGGSTITQQLAKALYVSDDHTLRTKFPLMGVALKLEQRYSKAQILEMYVNVIYYGDGQWGIAQASHTYFEKAPQHLDWAEVSLLAGLPQAPSLYDPITHFALARTRQRHVLDRLVATGVLSPQQADAAFAELTHLDR